MYTVRLNGLKYHSFHGLYPQEAILGNNFEVDVEVSLEKELEKQNDISTLIDYTSLKDVVDLYMDQRFELLEDVLAYIVKDIEGLYPMAKGEVSIKKLNPPFGGRCNSSQVILKF